MDLPQGGTHWCLLALYGTVQHSKKQGFTLHYGFYKRIYAKVHGIVW